MCSSVLQNKDKEKYIESSPVVSLPAVLPCSGQDTSLTVERLSSPTAWSSTEQAVRDTGCSFYPCESNLSTPTAACETEQSQYKKEMKRERSRRLAREFRARKKEEILRYRAVIVSLTNKVREMTIENRKLQHLIEELKASSIYSGSSVLELESDSSRTEQFVHMQKQVLQLQILLSNLTSSRSRTDHHQMFTHSNSHEISAFTLPPLKAGLEISQNSSPCSIFSNSETSPRQLYTPRLNDVTFSYCTTDTGTAKHTVKFSRDGEVHHRSILE
ncbi:hypothetical protein Gasu2_59060 [Galdieria sulphuraria]|uniref:BZIP domain-containing protein n=1 Tax=Galdieria sulphuraria TaxID=130081 RepID=M2VXJ5_GALSU|nr:hypothetical protein Gasu_44930 isoform 1 [Galdieria sulphuraria]XP_005704511.1 hypothetical protein Gasu_44930 isoform 2 [Galdieria sulphuraria]EME27990.1 hypothetical protein isoform 1 [Galdieria sulphuraria]EME27991.1 hypothetical protein isoform 2 [Galdieria sulphuraria]GJD11780.1 hypothetical protein Gasu2_59060 [Galdieria sulphuraria]|eukprot:XP_005704510.1 hypothetical protein isoform 1 [Galdieria sulphuraria]